MTKQVVIIGSTGFLGDVLVKEAAKKYSVKAIYRQSHPDYASKQITWCKADLLEKNALTPLLSEDDVVINVAYDASNSSQNVLMIDNLIDACISAGVQKLIHCSTAVVIGDIKQTYIDEKVPCYPKVAYEKTKHTIEQRLLHAKARGLHSAILRPTGILGAKGQNLKKLSDALLKGNPVFNYLRACASGKRRMNLVPVRNVASALLHLIHVDTASDDPIYILSSDDEPGNHFMTIERMLLDALQLPPRRFPVIQLPLWVLSFLLRVLGRSSWQVNRYFSSKKILETHFHPPDTLQDAIIDFGADVLNEKQNISL